MSSFLFLADVSMLRTSCVDGKHQWCCWHTFSFLQPIHTTMRPYEDDI